MSHSAKRSRIELMLLVLGILLIASNLRAPITAVGPLVGTIIEDTHMSNTMAGLLTTLPLLGFAALSPLAPKLARQFGTEATLLAALFILTLGIILRSVPSVASLFLGTAMLGLAIAAGNVLLPSLIKREFPHRIGLFTGSFTLTMSIWAAIASGVSVPIAQGLGYGWRVALLCWAGLSVITFMVWFRQLRHTPPKVPMKVIKAWSPLWHSKVAWQVTLFMGLQSIAFYSAIAWLPEVLYDKGISLSHAGWMLSMMQFISLPAAFGVPLLAARLPNQRGIVTVTAILYIVGYTGLLSGHTEWLTLSILMLGLAQGSSISLALTLFGLRSTNAHQAAELSGMAQSIGYLLAAGGPILFGFFHDLTHSWNTSLLFLLTVSILQFIVGLGAGRNVTISVSKDQVA